MIGEHDGTTAYSTNPTYQAASARSDYVFAGPQMIWNRSRSSGTGSWTANYYLKDRLSERIALDTSGSIIGRQAHGPFGGDFAESGTQEKHHFTSYERDSETGVDYAINRHYAVSVGRFMRVDPLPSSAKEGSGQSWNRYAYAANDPVNHKDPGGLLETRSTAPWEEDPCDPEGFLFFGGPYTPDEFCFFSPIPGGWPGSSEPGRACDMYVDKTQGDTISSVTPEINNLKFVASGNDIIGAAATGLNRDDVVIKNGYFWNTYIYAVIYDHSGLNGTWTARQTADYSAVGTLWNGSDPASAYFDSDKGHRDEDAESPYSGNTRKRANYLAWIDSPGWDPNLYRKGFVPYNFEVTFNIVSKAYRGKTKVCERAWTYKIKWVNGVLTVWDVFVH